MHSSRRVASLLVLMLHGQVGSATSPVFSTLSAPGLSATANGKFAGAAAVGTKIYFCPEGPYDSLNYVGVTDWGWWTTGGGAAFSTIATTGDAASGTDKYGGAVAVGTKMYCVPHDQSNVGVLDTNSNAFSTIACTGDAISGTDRYNGGAVVGTKLYFAPLDAGHVGVLDTSTDTFSTISAVSGSNKYKGAAAVGTKVLSS